MDPVRVFAVLRRRWLLLVAVTLLGIPVAVGLTMTRTKQYSSTATVFFSLGHGSSVSEIAEGTDYTQALVPSYAQVVKMPVVLEPVISRLGLNTTATELSHHVQVTLDQNSSILQVQVTDTSASRASAVADAIAGQLSTTVPTLSPQTGTGKTRISVTTISPATTPTSSLSTKPSTAVAVGAIGGLALALLLIGILELAVSSPIRDREAADRLGVAPVLGTIVYDPKAKQRPVPISTHPYLARAEGIRLLLTNLRFLRAEGASQCLVVTSAAPGEGRTSTAVNLAIGMCHTGQRVLLIDADLRHPGVTDLLGIDGSQGLSTVLTGESKVQDVIQTWLTQIWGENTLSVLPAGPPPPNPSELLASDRMMELLVVLRQNFDVVILDSAALLPVTDGALLSAQTDGALLVIDSQKTSQKPVLEAVELLKMAGSNVLGLVLNRVPEDRHQYGATRPTQTTPGTRGGRHPSKVDVLPEAGPDDAGTVIPSTAIPSPGIPRRPAGVPNGANGVPHEHPAERPPTSDAPTNRIPTIPGPVPGAKPGRPSPYRPAPPAPKAPSPKP